MLGCVCNCLFTKWYFTAITNHVNVASNFHSHTTLTVYKANTIARLPSKPIRRLDNRQKTLIEFDGVQQKYLGTYMVTLQSFCAITNQRAICRDQLPYTKWRSNSFQLWREKKKTNNQLDRRANALNTTLNEGGV